jgi:hypothetical protein
VFVEDELAVETSIPLGWNCYMVFDQPWLCTMLCFSSIYISIPSLIIPLFLSRSSLTHPQASNVVMYASDGDSGGICSGPQSSKDENRPYDHVANGEQNRSQYSHGDSLAEYIGVDVCHSCSEIGYTQRIEKTSRHSD